MALNKTALKSGIKQLMDDMLTREQNSNEEFATRLSDLFESFVKSGTVTVNAGIAVTTSGTAVAQSGATTSTGTGTIN
jgi:hypothetical protein